MNQPGSIMMGSKDCRLPIADFQIGAQSNRQSAIGNRQCLILLALCGCLASFAACSSGPPDSNPTPVISGPPNTTYPMPPLSASLGSLGWKLTDGNRAVFSEFKGQVLVLDFYATWCGPCRDSVPHLIGLQEKYKDQGLKVVGLNVGGPGDAERVPEFAKKFGIQYALAKPDEELVMFLCSGSDAIPQTFVFDRDGQLVERLIGFGEDSGEDLDRAVESALKTSVP
jgi:cytochrome c biogenesis protein CcmG, thiol:disulfide interchange protein DsbE